MKKLFVAVIMIAMSIPMIACEKYDDFGSMSLAQSSPKINTTVVSIYPNARVVDIDRELRTYEVEIIDNGVKREVILDLSFGWIRTETEVRHVDLPEAVTSRIAAKYVGWRIDDAKLIDTPDGSHYRIEIEKNDRDRTVKITAAGEII